MEILLWGLKTIAAFDVWTFEHLLSGISIGDLAKKEGSKQAERLQKSPFHGSILKYEMILVLGVAYVWETLEHYLETGLAGAGVEYWFQGVETWANRFIADPLMLLLGYYLTKRFPKIVLPARLFSVAFLVTHIFILPHSMYLHYLF